MIFLDRADRQRFLRRLKDYKDRHNVSILCYCLMPNHYHLLVQQTTEEPLSNFISRLNLAYAMYFNKRYERVGPLFQGRFKAKNIERDEYLIHLSRYIHLNPLEIIGVEDVESYPWSSLQHYVNGGGSFINTTMILSYFRGNDPRVEYLKFVKEEGKQRLKLKLQELLFEEISPVQVRVLSTTKL